MESKLKLGPEAGATAVSCLIDAYGGVHPSFVHLRQSLLAACGFTTSHRTHKSMQKNVALIRATLQTIPPPVAATGF